MASKTDLDNLPFLEYARLMAERSAQERVASVPRPCLSMRW